jgi:hypothetical protein
LCQISIWWLALGLENTGSTKNGRNDIEGKIEHYDEFLVEKNE